LLESDRLLGLKEWPIDRPGSTVTLSSDTCEHGGASTVGKRASRASAGQTSRDSVEISSRRVDDPELTERLKAVIREFPPELDEPPGANPEHRPDVIFSARYALKGTPVEVVKLKADALAQQAEQLKECKRCGLYKVSTQPVFGIGHPDTRIVFVGEAPGAQEDRMGYPFVGRAGVLLTAMVEKGMGLRREHVYICNVVKHRPPENRTPATDEMAACQDHLWLQLSVLEPEIIVALGAPAMQTLLSTKSSLGKMRGQAFDIHLSGSDLAGGPVAKCAVTYHPAYLLRNPGDKSKAWDDLKRIMAMLGIPARAPKAQD